MITNNDDTDPNNFSFMNNCSKNSGDEQSNENKSLKSKNYLIQFQQKLYDQLTILKEAIQSIIKAEIDNLNSSDFYDQKIKQELSQSLDEQQSQIQNAISFIGVQIRTYEKQLLIIIEKNAEQINLYQPQILDKNNQLNLSKTIENIKSNSEQESFNIQCLINNYQFIQLSDQFKYDILILHQNISFYCFIKGMLSEQDTESSHIRYYINGKLYKVQYDTNFNPNFEKVEGKFLISLKNKDFKLLQRNKTDQAENERARPPKSQKNPITNNKQQSNTYSAVHNSEQQHNYSQNTSIQIYQIRNVGQNSNYEQQETSIQSNKININDSIERSSSAQANMRKQRKIDQQDSYKTQSQSTNLTSKKIWYKYNQQITIRENIILNGFNKAWLNSSIVDSYIMRLNIDGEKQYFNKNQTHRTNIERVLFISSSFITQLGIQFDIQKARDLLSIELSQFQDINFEIRRVYSKIGFVRNKHKTHWQFILFDLSNKLIELFDSQVMYVSDDDANLTQIIQILQQLLQIENRQVQSSIYSGQQRDGYSCGYHICTYMKYCYEKQFDDKIVYCYNELEMKKILELTIKDLEGDLIDN